MECEKYNNQDTYAKYAKMQRSLLKMEKLTKTSKFPNYSLILIVILYR